MECVANFYTIFLRNKYQADEIICTLGETGVPTGDMDAGMVNMFLELRKVYTEADHGTCMKVRTLRGIKPPNGILVIFLTICLMKQFSFCVEAHLLRAMSHEYSIRNI